MKEQRKAGKISHGDKCLVVVAHPDDETLWAGGLILSRPDAEWVVLALTRGSDPDRAPKFHKAMNELRARGIMGDLDDSRELPPLKKDDIQKSIIDLIPSNVYDIIITHSLKGEYSRHIRHEEIAEAAGQLWDTNRIISKELWRFAYEDGGKKYLPHAESSADFVYDLPKKVWQKKHEIITEVYGFSKDSFEARTTPRKEAFWIFRKQTIHINIKEE